MDSDFCPTQLSFYLTCLHEISRTFKQPLTLLHHEKNRQLKTLQQLDDKQKQQAQNSDYSNAKHLSLNEDILRILLWLSHYIIFSVGEDILATKVSFAFTSYMEAKKKFENQPPFKDLVQHSIITDENINESLNLLKVASFKSLQKEAITSSLSGVDTLCLFPTGYGKSLIYQLPAVMEYGVSFLFSPLCSLLSDQLDTLNRLGIKSVWINAHLSIDELDSILVSLNTYVVPWRIVLLTPEKYTFSWRIQSVVDNLHRRQLIKRFIFDEVHCLSQWGRGFRPSYLQLASIRKKFPEVPILALTATANAVTILDIQHLLSINNGQTYRHSFNRSNLSLNVIQKPVDVDDKIALLVKKRFVNLPGIIYCRTRKECETLQKVLKQHGLESSVYHSKVKDSIKEQILVEWKNGDVLIVVATIAFGLGW